MTINWLIFTNETCVALRQSTKYHTRLVRICIFFNYPLTAGSARKAVVIVSDGCRNTCFRQYGADSVYDLVFSTTSVKSNSRKG